MVIAPLGLLAIRPDLRFPAPGRTLTAPFAALAPGFAWNEAVISWNLTNPAAARMRVEACAWHGNQPTTWYTLADWTADAMLGPRVSVAHRRDPDGRIATDILVLTTPADRLQLRVTLSTLAVGPRPRLRLLTVSFLGAGTLMAVGSTPGEAWGTIIDVPQRAQGDYPNGHVLCSPTAISMLLGHYSQVLHRPELDRDVPEVTAQVRDAVYRGAGNWSFNVAYVGSFPGLRAYVARLSGIGDLEQWIAAGLPLVCSVSRAMLTGGPAGRSGHLVVLVGFTQDGDPVVNDPAGRGNVRQVYKRAVFDQAWLYAKRTVYIVHPEGVRLPQGSDGRWLEN